MVAPAFVAFHHGGRLGEVGGFLFDFSEGFFGLVVSGFLTLFEGFLIDAIIVSDFVELEGGDGDLEDSLA